MTVTVPDIQTWNTHASWSTEATMKQILAAMPGRGESAAQRATREAANRNTDAVNQSRNALVKAFDGVGAQWSNVIKDGVKYGFGGPADSLKTFGGSLSTVSKNIISDMPMLGKAAGIAGFALTEMANGVKKLIEVNDTFKNVYASGVRLEGGLQGMMVAAQDAGMTVQEFGSLMEKHSSTVAVLGSTRTPALIKQFQEMTKRGGDLMMTQGEASEAFMQASEIFQQTGDRSSMTLGQLAQSSKGLILETNNLSKETGQSRKTIMEFISSVTKSGSAYLLLSTMGKGAGETFAYAAGQATKFGQSFGKMLTDNMQKFLAGNGSLGLLDDNFRMLANLVPGANSAFLDLNKAMASGDKKGIAEATKRFGNALGSAPDSLKNQLLVAMPELAGVLGDAAQNYAKVKEKEKRDLEEDAKVARTMNISLAAASKIRLDREAEEERRNKELQASVNEMDAATKNLNTEFTRMYVAVGKTIVPLLAKLAEGINAVISGFHWAGKTIGMAAGQTEQEAEATGGNTAGIMGMLTAGGALYGGYRGLKALRGGAGNLIPPPTPPPLPVPSTPGGGAGGMGRFGAMMGRGVGIAGVAGLAGGLMGNAVGGTAGSMISGAAGMGATGAMLGSMFGPIGTVVGGLAGLGLGAYQAYKASKEEQAHGGGADIQQGRNPIADLDALLEGREGMNIRYTESGKALTAFSNGYRDAVTALNLNINPANLQSLGSLQDILMGRSSGLTAGQFAGFNFAETTARYYDNSQLYYTTTTNLFTEIRDFSRQMKDDMASIKTMADNLIRNMNNRPQGTPQPSGSR